MIASGAIMVAGMAAARTLLDQIDDQYLVGPVPYAPYFFMGAGVGVIAVGGYLISISGRRAHYNNLDDLR